MIDEFLQQVKRIAMTVLTTAVGSFLEGLSKAFEQHFLGFITVPADT